jgi:Restriction endonuclease fold toxin 3
VGDDADLLFDPESFSEAAGRMSSATDELGGALGDSGSVQGQAGAAMEGWPPVAEAGQALDNIHQVADGALRQAGEIADGDVGKLGTAAQTLKDADDGVASRAGGVHPDVAVPGPPQGGAAPPGGVAEAPPGPGGERPPDDGSPPADSANGGLGGLVSVNAKDPAAELLAQRIGGRASVRFADGPANEFDAVSNEYVAQAKPANFTLNKAFRDQAKVTFEVALQSGRTPYFQFDGPPGPGVLQALNRYASRYGIQPVIDIVPLGGS